VEACAHYGSLAYDNSGFFGQQGFSHENGSFFGHGGGGLRNSEARQSKDYAAERLLVMS
jgi:hypothetical protein